MKNLLEGYFYNPTKGNLNINQMIDEVLRGLGENDSLREEMEMRRHLTNL